MRPVRRILAPRARCARDPLPTRASLCETLPVLLPVDVRALDDAHVVGTWARTFIQIWRGVPTAKATADVNRFASAFVAADTFRATSLFIVEPRSPAPDDEPRKNFAAFSRDIVGQMSLAVIVSEGGGFRGALVRAVGVTLTTMVPHRSHFKFVNDVETAAQLLKPYLLPGSGGAEALLRVVEDLRGKIGTPKLGPR
jgi:hypothetical protein